MHPVFLHDGTPAVPATVLGQGPPGESRRGRSPWCRPGLDLTPAALEEGQPPHEKMTEPSTGPTSSIP